MATKSKSKSKKKKKAKYSGIGGQAVMEGIMMRNNNRYAVAVRKPDQKIEVILADCADENNLQGIRKVPFIRGIFAFVDSLRLGMKTLSLSAEYYVGDEEETGFDRFMTKLFGNKAESIINAFTILFALVLAIGLFFVLPAVISHFVLERYIANQSLVIIMEGLVRILIFILYLLIISLSKDIKRTFMYHGAEHKCINCIENGKPLNVKNVMRSSRRHRRCGTSFILFIMMISIALFFFIRVDSPFLRLGIRILMIPVIAGISYEVLRAMGRFDNWFTRAVSAPGLWFQSLTTKEPDKEMAEVAIKAVEAVFDWKEYLKENFGYVPSGEEEGWLDDDEEMDTETMEALMDEVEKGSSEIMAEMDDYAADDPEE
ncbi:MAG: DUF1385 domain-containing protein [Lachnospiraceae bacterium]|nr:DUF1385 domain-containing protein [Lachnospiraceae bacterium]